MKQLKNLQDTCEEDYKWFDTSHSYIMLVKAFGGTGKFGREKFTISTELTSFSSPSEFSKV